MTANDPGRRSSRRIEVRSIDWIPLDERHGTTRQQAMLWFLGNFTFFTITVGFVGVSLGSSMGWSIVAGTLGIAFGTIFAALHASQGPKLGLPQMLHSRAQFGYRGVVVGLFAAFFTFMAFNVADQILLASGLHETLGWNERVIEVAVTLAGALIAIFGHDWIHRVFRVLLVVSLPLYVVITVAVLVGHAGGRVPSSPGGFSLLAFASQFTAAAAYNVSYAPYVSDYSRYLPVDTSSRRLTWAVFAGASVSAVWLIGLGAWMASRLGVADGLVGLRLAGDNVIDGMGSMMVALAAAAVVATIAMNAYCAALSALTAVDSTFGISPTRAMRVATISVLAVVWYATSRAIGADAVVAVFGSLTLALYLLAPWTAINLTDYFVLRRTGYVIADLLRPAGVYGTWRRDGLVAYAVGFAAQIPFMSIPANDIWTYTGPLAHRMDGLDVAWIVGLVVAATVYWSLARRIDRVAERQALDAAG